MNASPLWWVVFCIGVCIGALALFAWMMLHQDDKF